MPAVTAQEHIDAIFEYLHKVELDADRLADTSLTQNLKKLHLRCDNAQIAFKANYEPTTTLRSGGHKPGPE